MVYIVGISGGSASGKTTFINKLTRVFEAGLISVLSQDNYYKPIHKQVRDKKGNINFDEPESIDHEKFLSDIEFLKAGKELVIEEYLFNNSNKKPATLTIKPAQIIIVEGLFILGNQPLENHLDLKLFIDADEDVKFNRRIKRDRDERGMTEVDILTQWYNHVVPSYQKYVLPNKIKADILIVNNHNFEIGLNLVIEKITKWIDSQ